MSLTVILGLVIAVAASFLSMALLVRTSFGRVPHAISFLPAPLVLFDLRISAWFVFECLRQFALTAMTPAAALRLVAFVILVAELLALAFQYGCVSVVHQFLGGRPARLVRRTAKYLAVIAGALLVAGWSAYHFNADPKMFTMTRSVIGFAEFPVVLGAWGWLLVGGGEQSDATWRAQVTRLAKVYIALFSVALVLAVLRDRLAAVAAVLPLAGDVVLVLAYTTVTVFWVEAVQKAARPPHMEMPTPAA